MLHVTVNQQIEKMSNTTENTPLITNKGKGAGGSNTNYYGKKFEVKTNNQERLIEMGYEKQSFPKTSKKNSDGYDSYDSVSKTFEDKTVVFVLQGGLKKYCKNKYNIDIFRNPDEAYIIEYTNGTKAIKILEKKEQNMEGSVETKLWAGPALKREYELVLGDEFNVDYGFCVSSFLQKKFISSNNKFIILNKILREHNIAVLFGDDTNYFETLDNWVAS